ncbi:MAG: TolB protein [Gemmatimonadetes bacterium]|nr:TolB protein [Gemmatimonadota bacterium]
MRLRPLAAALALLLSTAAALRAQDSTGVRLGLVYQTEYRPGFVVLPFAAASGAEPSASTAREIVARDLDYADRFEMKSADPGTRAADPVNAALWKERGADWVLAGQLRPSAGGVSLRLTLTDVVYGQVKGDQSFELPSSGGRGFRMAVHAASDVVVRWVTGQPGTAASRIAYTVAGRGSKEIWIVDSDGEGAQRVTTDGSIALSPAWSPDGRRIAYTSFRGAGPWLYERDLVSGADHLLSDRAGLNMTPAYAPDGRTLAFATTVGVETEVATYDVGRRCCLAQQTRGGRYASFSPSWSPDGSRFAFVSDRLGEPQIYVMSPGGDARLVSDYVYGQRGYSASPDWSPKGAEIAYHSRVGGSYQIVVGSADGGQTRLLTNSGRNEDPSWAPDGRHLVYASSRDGGGLYVLDTVTGRTRALLKGSNLGLPAWSPVLAR